MWYEITDYKQHQCLYATISGWRFMNAFREVSNSFLLGPLVYWLYYIKDDINMWYIVLYVWTGPFFAIFPSLTISIFP